MASESVPQRGLGQETGGVGGIVDVLDGGHRIPDPELDYGIHIDRHTVFSENLGEKVKVLRHGQPWP